ncbi:alpha/beta hydrolase family protein [Chelatococcus reniformis]|uniref:Alpha/beta hydrolase n=1 Tax=Chelatococcus reniformis TaxID=1494448 RepID=A0A916UL73_9HYPH|nr:alpha/beta fold hydrolase [Chelatococcus reniformis]GGC77188.1 alpha/beta hydrolase [Chelatococcus reniformis]
MDPQPITITCRDGYRLGGHLWASESERAAATVIVNPATGVLARYYHAYARWLAEQGFAVVTYDYRGIGASRPPRLRGSAIRWRDWGELDFDAAAVWAKQRDPHGRLWVVGHSIGGMLVGFAPAAVHVDRLLTMGAQYAYWRDYAAAARARLLLKWHLAMPAITATLGFLPGKRLGWLEDLPAGVAFEWCRRRARFEWSYPVREREPILGRFAAVTAPILAIGVSDDEFGTPQAIARTLAYYRGSERRQVMLTPRDLGYDAIGHFSLFHARHRDGFWPATLGWLRDDVVPWPVGVALAPEREGRAGETVPAAASRVA